MNYLADSITLLSLSCGFISIIFSLEGHFTFASWAIILSVILDGIDGQIARHTVSSSEFGKELDSLVDVVSFGIAPSILGYIFIYRRLYLWAVLFLLLYLVCSVIRLAKYNITPKGKAARCFYGLPTTVSGGLLASFVLIFRNRGINVFPDSLPVIFICLVFMLSLLMISRIRYPNLDGLKELLGKRLKFSIFILASLFAIGVCLNKTGIALFSFFLIYLIFSPFVVKRLSGNN